MMLCQFTFANYKSYREETTIEMQAENIDEFEDTLIVSQKDGKRYLPISAIYGPNGGGKTNALEALVCMIGVIISPILAMKSNEKIGNIQVIPYRFSEENKPVDFEVYYRINENEYRYNISFFNKKICYESLYILTENAKKPTKIFVRENDTISLGEELTKEKVSKNNNINIPYLSFLAISYNIETINMAISFFLNTTLLNCNDYSLQNAVLDEIIEDEEMKKKFISLLNNMDIEIENYRVEKIDDIQNTIKVYTEHILDEKKYELNLMEESQGTQKLFTLLPMIISSIMQGNLTVIDELDAKLHPKLVQYIIDMYKDKTVNKKGAQLLISSHDLTTMTKEVFRRDEILFAARNKEGSSELYSLYEIRDINGEHIRKTVAYNKQYIEGRYGADPYLRQILNWEVE